MHSNRPVAVAGPNPHGSGIKFTVMNADGTPQTIYTQSWHEVIQGIATVDTSLELHIIAPQDILSSLIADAMMLLPAEGRC